VASAAAAVLAGPVAAVDVVAKAVAVVGLAAVVGAVAGLVAGARGADPRVAAGAATIGVVEIAMGASSSRT
jgi:hypothetical protein